MPMNHRDFELIALGHVLTRYRLSGDLPKIDGKPFNLNEFRSKILTGIDDSDININIDTLQTESNVTIIENDCDHDHENANPQNNATVSSEISLEQPADKSTTATGKLFDYFTRNKQS